MRVNELFQATCGTSVLTTCRKCTALIYGICWIICLPFELVLHRRVGKRYMNTILFVVAFLTFGIAAALMTPDRPTLQEFRVSPVKAIAALRRAEAHLAPFNYVLTASLIAFGAHWYGNRRRFGTPAQGHSLDNGIPWYIYPPFSRWLIRMRKPMTDGEIAYASAVAEANATGLARVRRHLQQRSTLARAISDHLKSLKNGEPPHSQLTWLTIAWFQPSILLATGLILALNTVETGEFGVYLCVVSVAMFVKGRIQHAEWVERIYDECDQKLVVEAMRRLRSGQELAELSSVFTIPVSQAVVAPRRSSSSTQGTGTGVGSGYTQASLFSASDAARPPETDPA